MEAIIVVNTSNRSYRSVGSPYDLVAEAENITAATTAPVVFIKDTDGHTLAMICPDGAHKWYSPEFHDEYLATIGKIEERVARLDADSLVTVEFIPTHTLKNVTYLWADYDAENDIIGDRLATNKPFPVGTEVAIVKHSEKHARTLVWNRCGYAWVWTEELIAL